MVYRCLYSIFMAFMMVAVIFGCIVMLTMAAPAADYDFAGWYARPAAAETAQRKQPVDIQLKLDALPVKVKEASYQRPVPTQPATIVPDYNPNAVAPVAPYYNIYGYATTAPTYAYYATTAPTYAYYVPSYQPATYQQVYLYYPQTYSAISTAATYCTGPNCGLQGRSGFGLFR